MREIKFTLILLFFISLFLLAVTELPENDEVFKKTFASFFVANCQQLSAVQVCHCQVDDLLENLTIEELQDQQKVLAHIGTSTQCEEISKQYPSKFNVRMNKGITTSRKHDNQKVDYENAEVIQIVSNGFIYKDQHIADFETLLDTVKGCPLLFKAEDLPQSKTREVFKQMAALKLSNGCRHSRSSFSRKSFSPDVKVNLPHTSKNN
jgi:hypothetical protein